MIYFSDNYVHRLVQNKGDGKLVEVAGEGQALPSDQKIDSLQLEVRSGFTIMVTQHDCLNNIVVFLSVE